MFWCTSMYSYTATENDRSVGLLVVNFSQVPSRFYWPSDHWVFGKTVPACIALAHTDYLNVRYSFVLVVLHCNYYPYLTYLWPEISKMISDNSSLHASSNTGYHSHSNGSWRNAQEVFLCTERLEETDCNNTMSECSLMIVWLLNKEIENVNRNG